MGVQSSDKPQLCDTYYGPTSIPPPTPIFGRYGARRCAEMRLLILSLAVLFAVAQQAGGDDPAPDQWPKTVESLGTALADNDAAALLGVLSDDVTITTCDMKNGDAVRLLARTKKGTLISTLSYVFAPETMANDIAEAF